MRIVSLIPSATEILCGLGLREALVGRSHECDFPKGLENLPVLTEPRFDVSGSSREIDAAVKRLSARETADALGVYKVDVDRLRELQPTHIVTQAQCEVCAVSLRDVEAAVAEITGLEARIVSLQPNGLNDVWRDFQRVAEALNAPAAGSRLVSDCLRRLAEIQDRADEAPPIQVVGIEWADPLMAFGNWTPSLIAAAGGVNLFGEAGRHSPWIEWEQIRAADPQAIIVGPCGFTLARGRVDLELLRKQPGWQELRAVRDGRVYLVDGHNFINRPGPRLVETAEIFAEILHSDAFDFGHEDKAWERAVG